MAARRFAVPPLVCWDREILRQHPVEYRSPRRDLRRGLVRDMIGDRLSADNEEGGGDPQYWLVDVPTPLLLVLPRFFLSAPLCDAQ
jgi:hypothetical protein